MKMGVDEEEATLAGVGFDGGTPSLSSSMFTLFTCTNPPPSMTKDYFLGG